jgi:hypothetical protein
MGKFAVLWVLAGCLRVYGWSAEGHHLVARIAEAQLTPAARAQVAAILGPGATLVSVSAWADEVRGERRETGTWHYIDIPINQPHLDMARDCPKNECVLAKIEDFRKALSDPALEPVKRREALMFLVHFVGDMHQPLHCSDHGDRGGNSVRVLVPPDTRPSNLHSAWDGTLLKRVGTEDKLYPQLSRDALKHAKQWSRGTVSDWAEQNHKAARKTVYGKLPKGATAPGAPPVTLTADYERKADPLMEQQIEKAGDRLARILNETLR